MNFQMDFDEPSPPPTTPGPEGNNNNNNNNVPRVFRLCEVDVGKASRQFIALSEQGSVSGGAVPCLSALLSFASLNRKGSTQQVEFSPRQQRARADQSVKGGFAALVVYGNDGGGGDDVKEDEDALLGGILFHYDRDANVGTILELVSRDLVPLEPGAKVRKNARTRCLKMLQLCMTEAIEQIHDEARLNGQLAGCNALFCVLGSRSDPYGMLHALKVEPLDFQLENILNVPGDFSLGVVLTPQLPLVPQVGALQSRYFVPTILLERFLRSQASVALVVTPVSENSLFSLEKQLAKLAFRSKIPTVTWSRGLMWQVVDLREDFDPDLLKKFHDIASTMQEEHIPSLDELEKMLSEDDATDSVIEGPGQGQRTHIFVALQWQDARSEFDMVGGMIVDYASWSNSAVISSWFLARPGKTHNRRHEASRVLDWVRGAMRQEALECGHIAGLHALFLEAVCQETSRSIMNICADHLLLQKLSFRRVALDYFAAENEEPQTTILTVFVDENTPRSEYDAKHLFLPAQFVKEVLLDRFVEATSLSSASSSITSITSPRGGEQLDGNSGGGIVASLSFGTSPRVVATSPVMGRGSLGTSPLTAVPFPLLARIPSHSASDLASGASGALRSMLRQVRMQEERGVPLLELPWSGTSAPVMVDLFDDFDPHLAESFHKALPADRVNDFEVWKRLMEDDEPAAPTSLVPSDPFELHVLLPVECQPGIDVHSTGGLLIFYYSASNSGVIAHVLPPADRPLASLLTKARMILDRCARERGFLSGCNAVFLELNTARGLHMSNEELHEELRDAGFRLVNLTSYEPPKRGLGSWARHQTNIIIKQQAVVPTSSPLSASISQQGDTLLLAHLGDFVPVDSVIGDFLPSSVLIAMIVDRWKAAFSTKLIQEVPENTPAFTQMIQSLQRATKVALRDLPWIKEKGSEWVYVNLGRTYDEALLTTWYNTVLKPNFPLEDEVESLESFRKGLVDEPQEDDAMLREIILVVKWVDAKPVIGGGIVYEYYFESNCGLISFLVVAKNTRGQGLSRELVERAARELEVLSVEDGGALAGCNAIFLETNAVASLTMEQDVMDPRLRHLMYNKMGFRLLDFPYVMPPIEAGKPKVYFLLLLCYVTPKIPFDEDAALEGATETKPRYVPGVLLQRFFADQWQLALQYGRLPCPPEEDADYQIIMSSLSVTKKVRLLEMPWVRSKPWTLVDLREHWDEGLFEEMLVAFREVYPGALEKDVPAKALRDSLVTQELLEEQEDRIFHVVVAMVPPAVDEKTVQEAMTDLLSLEVAAVMVMEYYPDLNVARIAYDFARVSHASYAPEDAVELLTDLIDHGRSVVQRTAVNLGHIAGCSALFVSVNLGEERVIGEKSGMMPFCTLSSAQQLGFLKVPRLHLTKGGTDTLLVLDSPIIPTHDTDEKTKYLPTRLLLAYAKRTVQDDAVIKNLEKLVDLHGATWGVE